MADMLVELARREKIAGIKPDGDLDIFMKVRTCSCLLQMLNMYVVVTADVIIINFQSLALGGQETSLVVEYIMKVFARCWLLLSLVLDSLFKY